MSQSPRPFRVEELLVHAQWLGRLATHVARPGDDAEDAVQDTWLAALRHPPSNDRTAQPWLAEVNFWACADPVWDMDRVHDLIDHFVTAFMLDVQKGDKDAHKVLLPDAVKFVGIQYKTTMKYA